METIDLRNVGLKVTLPRVKILEILENQTEERHLTAEKVYKILLNGNEEIGLATVYRVLTQFEAAGLVTRHHFEGGNSVFELNKGSHHDHIVCIKCGMGPLSGAKYRCKKCGFINYKYGVLPDINRIDIKK